MQSSAVCCLSDIPIAHLSYQVKRYGKIAVGFHREAVVKHGFNPVFYTLQNTDVLRSIRRGFRQLGNIDGDSIAHAASQIESELDPLECDEGHEVSVDVSSEIRDIKWGAKEIMDDVSLAEDNLKKFLAFVKTFDTREFSTIYCEREWRSTRTFSFSFDDVAMVVLPRGNAQGSHFTDFVDGKAKALNLARSVPVVPWEDLIEH